MMYKRFLGVSLINLVCSIIKSLPIVRFVGPPLL
jgi:hypothetical protein